MFVVILFFVFCCLYWFGVSSKKWRKYPEKNPIFRVKQKFKNWKLRNNLKSIGNPSFLFNLILILLGALLNPIKAVLFFAGLSLYNRILRGSKQQQNNKTNSFNSAFNSTVAKQAYFRQNRVSFAVYEFIPEVATFRSEFATLLLNLDSLKMECIVHFNESNFLYASSLSEPELLATFKTLINDYLNDQRLPLNQDALAIMVAYQNSRIPRGSVNPESSFDKKISLASVFCLNIANNQALEIFGLRSLVEVSEIRKIYRKLIRVFHPDAGGSLALCKLINRAKDYIVSRSSI